MILLITFIVFFVIYPTIGYLLFRFVKRFEWPVELLDKTDPKDVAETRKVLVAAWPLFVIAVLVLAIADLYQRIR